MAAIMEQAAATTVDTDRREVPLSAPRCRTESPVQATVAALGNGASFTDVRGWSYPSGRLHPCGDRASGRPVHDRFH